MHRFLQTVRGRTTVQTQGVKIVLSILLTSTLLLVLAAVPGQAQTFTFTAVLTSGQEVPPNTSKALGVAFVTFNKDSGELCFSISYDEFNLTSPETVAHFHAPARPGVNAPVIIPLPPGSPKNDCVTPDLTEDLRRALFQGLWYVNIHTEKHPDGEIRGQLVPQVAPVVR